MARLESKHFLGLAAVLTVALWQFHWGRLALYPFTLLATYAHEMGHGLTALLVGANFESLRMFPDGSGLARWTGSVGRVGRALVAAGGLVGPSVAGAILLAVSRRRRWAPYLLYVVGGLMLLSVLLFTRGWFAPVFVGVMGALLIGVARFAPGAGAAFVVQLVGVQLCLAVFRDVDYMFSPGGVVDGVQRPSDSAAIADALLLPYWFWGAGVAVFSFAVLGAGLWLALRPAGRGGPGRRAAET